jgi:hypothetical protein
MDLFTSVCVETITNSQGSIHVRTHWYLAEQKLKIFLIVQDATDNDLFKHTIGWSDQPQEARKMQV